jgi:outer membrane protein
MKFNSLAIWNAALTIAVAILLFLQLNKKTESSSSSTSNPNGLRIAYINVDTFQNHYTFFTDKKKELDVKQTQMQATYQQKAAAFQNDYTAAQKAAATMTPQQQNQVSQQLQSEQSDLQQLQSNLSTDLQTQLEQFNKQLLDSLNNFIKIYNADKKYDCILSAGQGSNVLYSTPQADITQDIIAGMNARLKK